MLRVSPTEQSADISFERLTLVFPVLTDDIDVADIDSVHPKVGLSALDDGRLLVGDRNHREQLRTPCDARTTETTHDERTQLFDELLGRIEKHA